jgi:bifunctional UDP-N-acetylglucosamine pyrophosphorylase/glucosamine-1-phosphate N-acetyltransferase
MEGNLAVVILAAGKSTRFNSAKSKLAHSLCGKPMVQWVIDATLPLSPDRIVVVYGPHNAELVDQLTAAYPGKPLAFVEQAEPLGTGDALYRAKAELGAPAGSILVLPGDAALLTANDLFALVAKCPPDSHGVLTTMVDEPGEYGRVVRGDQGPQTCEMIVEARDADAEQLEIIEINTGVYMFRPGVFEQLDEARDKFRHDREKDQYYLTDIVRVAPTRAILASGLPEPIGIDDRFKLAVAEHELQWRMREQWMAAGVTFHLPETTYMDHDVELAPDVEVGPHCVLTRGTQIGAGTVLVQGCLLEACRIGANCELRHVRGLESVIEDDVQAGPYVNMRPGTVLRRGVKVGNFVETKNADVGAGSKLPHLQYIGDATLGEGCNIGAGTIFCNYDGFSKLHTTLGPGVFVGSNSSLQGGITIGEGAYVAMASAITKDIPAGALAVGRARQENKAGYVAKLKERLARRKEHPQAGAGTPRKEGSGEQHAAAPQADSRQRQSRAVGSDRRQARRRTHRRAGQPVLRRRDPRQDR